MFVGLTNTPRDYAWGSTTAIAELFGYAPTGNHEAELWLGAHPGSPARVVGSDETLIDVLDGERLPFLLKILAAETHLSLQAHPNSQQAIEGFERENAAGVALDDPTRNYKDAFHKPELIVALSETFGALCGFRAVAETREVLGTLGDAAAPLLERLVDDASLPAVFEWLIAGGEQVDDLVAAVTDAAASAALSPSIATVRQLADEDPGDPGIVISLLLNTVVLRRGQSLYLPAGNIHAYLHGLGVELMAASDNVLRGGLTPKNVDVPELLRVLDFTPLPVPYLEPIDLEFGVEVFRPDVPDFELLHIVADASISLIAPAIAVCTAGSFTVGPRRVALGEAVYFTPDESPIAVVGEGELFVATSSIVLD
ncbi:mannose-6-phosphate isomerase, class I [soil metagenome]